MSAQPTDYQLSFSDLAYLETQETRDDEAENKAIQAAQQPQQYGQKRRAKHGERQRAAITKLAQSTTDQKATELLSDITGLSRDQAAEVLAKAGGLHELARIPLHCLQLLPYMTPKRASIIRKMTEWAETLSKPAQIEKVQMRSPVDVANLFLLEMSLLDHEQLRVVGMDSKNNVKFEETIYKGSLNSAVVRVAEIFREAIIRNCASIVLAHNHPSGDPTPSPEDVRVTELIIESGEKLDIQVLDHIIIGNNRYVSLKERGLGFR